MKTLPKSNKSAVIELMHHVHTNDTLSLDEVESNIREIMKANKLEFKTASEIDGFIPDVSDISGAFFYNLNSPKYNDPAWFSSLVENWIDVTPLIAIDNAKLYRNRVQSGDFSFEAIAGMVSDLNRVLYPQIFKRA